MAEKFIHYSETVKHQVSQFLLDHSIEVEQASCNALSPESELTTQYKLDLFDTCFSGVLNCYKRNPKRFTAYLNYYGKTPLIEKIKNDLPAIGQSLQNANKE